ncbi:uncharacterized protein LOC104896770 [Beta vulgaris subsp. vulgaris]|uniref:uncharacterized protein LOC104896770 n=1 Tax=Beta vulgaris subsp. vulgaris TaxID=3555 RepID=UPI002036A923|nr:uncharacterized protein LOC104896770 [Beta vulgaris subsp. vulgaris]
MAANWDSDEWEVVNDDGFVYKRKKRRLDRTSFARAADPEPDLTLAIKEKRKRKRAALLKIKEKYQTEIILWENLSNTLKTMEESMSEQVEEKQTEEREGEKLQRSANKGSQSVVSVANSSGSLVDELLLQVEAQEAIIRSFEQLCDVADSLCNAQEEKNNQRFFNLPIWHSPRELMASLCDD